LEKTHLGKTPPWKKTTLEKPTLEIASVKLYLKGKRKIQTCSKFGCTRRSLMRWVKKYDENTVSRKANKLKMST